MKDMAMRRQLNSQRKLLLKNIHTQYLISSLNKFTALYRVKLELELEILKKTISIFSRSDGKSTNL